MQTQRSQREVLRILSVLAEGGYLSHASRSVDLRFGSYHPKHDMFGLVRLRFEAHPSSAYTLRPVVRAIKAAAGRGGAALLVPLLLHLSWFVLAALTFHACLRSAVSHRTNPEPAMNERQGWSLSSLASAPPGLRRRMLHLLLAAAQAAAAVAYVVVEIATARLPTPHRVRHAALQSVYQDVNADARVLLPAKEAPPAGVGGMKVDVAEAATSDESQLACGVELPWQLWNTPAWALPDNPLGMQAFGRDLVRSPAPVWQCFGLVSGLLHHCGAQQ